ncbi:dihydroxyacetone kinase phosphoryl donor subunit DhaM [Thermogemmatispora tikiterensis]|uniref:phosphoenolpyruvate--glycerone phosphotransferase n=1 Tax=Thermogemmatispora tikiterensis TaxID=1825093 RepID=A0A328VHM6_9CHLR|nr:dihydroxyacetone kinase phosphoryl donor subunit DhaM [Thermogemmatispora tikiterensis]RAQ97246.1 PTS mannose transporter subunit IID [Thermogemmatispora tikiterensis]
MTVGLVIVSHSARLAEGVAELAGQMAQGRVVIAPAGGTAEGGLGTSVDKILQALRQAASSEGVLVLLDLGSAGMAAEMALELFKQDHDCPVMISSAPLVEGAVVAAVEASIGSPLQAVAEAAAAATTLPKLPATEGQTAEEAAPEDRTTEDRT